MESGQCFPRGLAVCIQVVAGLGLERVVFETLALEIRLSFAMLLLSPGM